MYSFVIILYFFIWRCTDAEKEWHYVKFFNTFDRVKSYGIEKSNKLCYSDIEDIHKDWSVTFPWNQP